MKTGRVALKIAICLAVLGVAGFLAWVLIETAPKTKPEDKERAVEVVQVVEVTPGDRPVSVTAFGSVIPAREVVIEPQVEGRILSQHDELVLGGRLQKGEKLFQIDPADYELALAERESDLQEAQFELEVEKGRRNVAEREWEQLKNDLPGAEVNQALVLRKPHQERIEAMVEKAENAISKARLDLERTTVEAPFNGMVTEESVEVGQLVREGSRICKLVGSDEFWVQATLPVNQLRWVRLPEGDRPGSAARVILDSGEGRSVIREGRVVRLLSDLEETGRMARVVVSVPDPLSLKSDEGPAAAPLLLGSYVRVEIEAGRLQNVISIPREALRRDDRIWVVDEKNQLQIRETEVLWTDRDHYLVANSLKPGERLIVSSLQSALPGMVVDPHLLDEESEALTTHTVP